MPAYISTHLFIAEQLTGTRKLSDVPQADFILYQDDMSVLIIEDRQEYALQDERPMYGFTMLATPGDWIVYSGHYPEGHFDNYFVVSDEDFQKQYIPADDVIQLQTE